MVTTGWSLIRAGNFLFFSAILSAQIFHLPFCCSLKFPWCGFAFPQQVIDQFEVLRLRGRKSLSPLPFFRGSSISNSFSQNGSGSGFTLNISATVPMGNITVLKKHPHLPVSLSGRHRYRLPSGSIRPWCSFVVPVFSFSGGCCYSSVYRFRKKSIAGSSASSTTGKTVVATGSRLPVFLILWFNRVLLLFPKSKRYLFQSCHISL